MALIKQNFKPWFQFCRVVDLALGSAVRKPGFESQLHHKLHDSGPVSQALELCLSIMAIIEDTPLRT